MEEETGERENERKKGGRERKERDEGKSLIP